MNSVRVYAEELRPERIWDNDLGWHYDVKASQEGFIFQSSNVSDDEVLAMLAGLTEIETGNWIMTGYGYRNGCRFKVWVWLDNPILEDYPLMANSEEFMKYLVN